MQATRQRWHPALVALHWLMALLVAAQFILAQQMRDETRDLIARLDLYQLHKSIGLCLAALLVCRLALRATAPKPANPEQAPVWQRWAARLVHAGLYLGLVALPISGFLMVSASPVQIPTILFGLVEVPHPIGPDRATFALMQAVHGWAGDGLLWLAAIHVAGAGFHQFAWGDNVLRRMWFSGRTGEPG